MNTNSRQTITNPHRHIPRAFRSQIGGRCQLQRITKEEHDAIEWVDEWAAGADAADKSDRQELDLDTRSQEYQISWRFVTNSGQDDTVIRPVIGKLGIPFYPGSSMKLLAALAIPNKSLAIAVAISLVATLHQVFCGFMAATQLMMIGRINLSISSFRPNIFKAAS